MTLSRYISDLGSQLERTSVIPVNDEILLDEQSFQRMISVERKRSERSRKPFLLMLVDFASPGGTGWDRTALDRTVSVLAVTTRETDVKGWYKQGTAMGVIFTEIGEGDPRTTVAIMLARFSGELARTVAPKQFDRISISFHSFPEDWDGELMDRPGSRTLYPDIVKRNDSRKVARVIKRVIDVAGSLVGLFLFAPLFTVIILAIKLTSKGPVLFRQTRIGQYGVPFTFIKFRSMQVNNDSAVHKEYVRQLIAGQAENQASGESGDVVYKLTGDSRITPVGRFLRRTSLDELPQLLNVLVGDMSLVGPRPPIAYEVEAYDVWHRSRLLEAKPGITGLWQVNGRSRVTFDEMVRLDLRYARTWSPWLDIKILLLTPRAVLDGAY